MAQAIVDPTILDGNIAELCDKLNQLSKKERDIKTNARTDVIIGEKENLLRRIRVERRINLKAQSLISEMIDQSGSTGLKLSDIESKFGLHKLHHETTLTRQLSLQLLLFRSWWSNFDILCLPEKS